MNWLQRKRVFQAVQFGWRDAKEIAKESGKNRIKEYYNFLMCFKQYYVFSNQYFSKRLWAIPKEERECIAKKFGDENRRHDDWVVDKYHNRKFIEKWSSLKWETSAKKSEMRKQAYAKQFNAGSGLHVQHNVDIHREHFLEGTIKIGNNVLLAKNVFIDYSGEVIINDNVSIANGVIIETHTHPLEDSRQKPVPGRLIIGDNASILSRSYIADTCHSIGRYARIGAGTYVRSNVPPYAIMMGNPAKIIGFLYSPEEMVAFEEKKYAKNERTSPEEYAQYYEKYFWNRLKEIKSFKKL